eukprot:TRINITY_DN65873_c8_g1_i1.p1 TRINITY_DN65873_c8_g1~~TRINITY_DN65873_c8_g1_i1.p1  ORF type:complete len:288 (+),score=142.71 TRINITY_DN65873_c8_g1_i1:18-881(+)
MSAVRSKKAAAADDQQQQPQQKKKQKQQQKQAAADDDDDDDDKNDNDASNDNDNDDDDDDLEDCCICMEPMTLPFKTPCGHTFCFLCLKGVSLRSQQNIWGGGGGGSKSQCPLCRADIDNKFFACATMDWRAYQRQNVRSGADFQWQYKGRKGWWLYESAQNAELEQFYADYLANSAANQPSKTYDLMIGATRYSIDFDNMVQYPSNAKHKRRTIRRQQAKEVIKQRDVKGQAGVYFKRTKSLEGLRRTRQQQQQPQAAAASAAAQNSSNHSTSPTATHRRKQQKKN